MFSPQFSDIKHNDDAMSAFVYVDKVSIEARIIGVLQ